MFDLQQGSRFLAANQKMKAKLHLSEAKRKGKK